MSVVSDEHHVKVGDRDRGVGVVTGLRRTTRDRLVEGVDEGSDGRRGSDKRVSDTSLLSSNSSGQMSPCIDCPSDEKKEIH